VSDFYFPTFPNDSVHLGCSLQGQSVVGHPETLPEEVKRKRAMLRIFWREIRKLPATSRDRHLLSRKINFGGCKCQENATRKGLRFNMNHQLRVLTDACSRFILQKSSSNDEFKSASSSETNANGDKSVIIRLNFRKNLTDVGDMDFVEATYEFDGCSSNSELELELNGILENDLRYCSHVSSTTDIITEEQRAEAERAAEERGYCLNWESDSVEDCGSSCEDD
jgi:hypothetical protein